jgi:hypothetical protein
MSAQFMHTLKKAKFLREETTAYRRADTIIEIKGKGVKLNTEEYNRRKINKDKKKRKGY